MIVKVNILWKLVYHYHHSHKKRKGSLETRSLYIEIYLISWNSPFGPKYRGSILRSMASYEGDQPLARAFHTIMDKTEADILPVKKKWIFMHQEYFFRKIPAINACFASKDVHLWGCFGSLGQNIKIFQPKYSNVMQEQTQVNKA